MAGPYPGALDPEEAAAKLREMLDVGVRVLIDLTEAVEHLEPYAHILAEVAEERGVAVEHHRFPIRDVSIPDEPLMRSALAQIREALAAGRIAYVHCWGGTGRTGTVIGCLLRENGTADGDVFARIRELRKGTLKEDFASPQTAEQCDFVLEWPGRLSWSR